jgi:hypothetical protein
MRDMTGDPENEDAADDDRLARVLEDVPKGALAVSLTAVALLLVGWFFVYLAIFIPRGMVD